MIFKKIVQSFFDFFSYNIADMPLFRNVAKIINKTFSPKNDTLVQVGKYKMYSATLDRIITMLFWKFSLMESYETKIMRDIVKEGMTVVDIGANIGYYSLILSDLVGKKGKVISIEPEPENFRLLLKNINANNKSNINSVKRALSDKDGAIDFFISEEHKGDHRSYDSGDKRKKIKVKSICLDAFLGSKIKPDIIKMDIQGAEYSAIKGMENTLKKKDVILLMEFSPSLIEKSGNSPKELLNLIEKMGFELKFINENKKSISNISKKELLKMCRGNKYTNLYLEKKHIQ